MQIEILIMGWENHDCGKLCRTMGYAESIRAARANRIQCLPAWLHSFKWQDMCAASRTMDNVDSAAQCGGSSLSILGGGAALSGVTFRTRSV